MASVSSPAPLATLTLRVPRQQIGFLRFILEGYDNMALMTTVDPQRGWVLIHYPPSFHDDLTAILEGMELLAPSTHEH